MAPAVGDGLTTRLTRRSDATRKEDRYHDHPKPIEREVNATDVSICEVI
jgi:hypothetical protein